MQPSQPVRPVASMQPSQPVVPLASAQPSQQQEKPPPVVPYRLDADLVHPAHLPEYIKNVLY
eukprot:8492253-Karenia_brevis.AAC.1